MKRLHLLSLAAIAMLLFACQKEETGYLVEANITGSTGFKAYLLKSYYSPADNPMGCEILDSVTVENDVIRFKGALEKAASLDLLLSKEDQMVSKASRRISFYVSPGKAVKINGDLSAVPSLFQPSSSTTDLQIEAGELETASQGFKSELKPLNAEISQAYEQLYRQMEADGEGFSSDTVIALGRKLQTLEEQELRKKISFIQSDAPKILRLDQAHLLLVNMGGSQLSLEQIGQLEAVLERDFQGTPEGALVQEQAKKLKNVAVGASLVSATLEQPKGEDVELLKMLNPDKLNLVEFWASWCGPCRGEIPHLRETYKRYSKDLEIISISMDANKAEWLTALKEEKMPWQQYLLPGSFEAQTAKHYAITGIPFALLTDGEGKILQTNARGYVLDLFLKERVAD